MISYRFKRRAFLTAMSGGLGLKIMLRNLEVSAQGMRSPARLLVTHWPVGIVAGSNNALWTPTSGSVGGSPGLKPFADAGLGTDMTVLRGVSTGAMNLTGGGSHEQGTVSLVTGLIAGGTRASCCEGDDAFASPGGSIEQILLKNVAALRSSTGGSGYANSIADSRTDFAEVSTQCLSYSTSPQMVNRYNNAGTAMEAIPLKPVLSPMQQFSNLFANFVPGNPGGTGGSGAGGSSATGGATGTGGRAGTGGAGGNAPPRVADAMLRQLASRRSVLDFAIEEINQLKGMVPSDARNKLTIHAEAIMDAESSITGAINANYPNVGGAMGTGGAGMGAGGRGGATGSGGSGMGGNTTPPAVCGGTCTSKPTPPPAVMGAADPNSGNGTGNQYGTGKDAATNDDSVTHQMVGKAHLDVLKAAFVCDLIRVGTYQWSPGTNHVGFKLYPGQTGVYQHHPVSHRITTNDTTAAGTPGALNPNAEFLYNVQLWYFQRHAENFAAWKTALDGCGNSLLDFTCVPFVTEVEATGHQRTNMPAMIIGGKQLGFTHNLYRTGTVSINQYWATIAQAFGYTSTAAPFAAPIAGLWAKPA
ncbi:MAG: DUF1552 domain-containing protein [Pseudomonadota bacterium]